MFSNNLIRSLCTSSDEHNLRLSENDWHLVLGANKNFTETAEEYKGGAEWGRYLLSKIKGLSSETFCAANSLELCCGNGFLYFSLANFLDFDDTSFFMDLSSSQCQQFHERCKTLNAPIPNLIRGDIGKLPFKTGSLNLVYGHSFLHHLPDVGEYLREIYRVLNTRGKFAVFHEPSLTASFWESFPISLYKNTDTNSLTDIWVISPEVITRLLIRAGFRVVSVQPNNLLASFFMTPIQLLLMKLSLPYNANWIVFLRRIFDHIDHMLPMKFRMKYSPSLAILAEK